jgi:hypothetical protein
LRLGRQIGATRQQTGALAVLTVISLLVTVISAAIFATPGIMREQRHVSDRTGVSSGAEPTGTYARLTSLDWKDTYTVRRVVVASTGNSAPPPGLTQFPAPGETWISPAVAAAAERDPDFAAHLPARVSGLISPQGLTSPALMLEYVGATPQQLAAAGEKPVSSFGKSEFVMDNRVIGPLALATIILLTGVPMAILMIAALGQLATRRASRFDALDAVGMPRWATRFALSIDGLAACFVGSCAGFVLFVILAKTLNSVPGIPAAWWPGQVQVTWWLMIASIALPVMLAASSAWLIRGRRTEELHTVRHGRIRLVPLLTGVALAATTSGTKADASATATLTICAAVTLITIGVPLAVPVLASIAGRRLISRGSATTMMAGAHLARGRPAARRAGTVMAGAVILATSISPLVAQAAPRDTAAAAVNEDLGRIVVVLSGLDPRAGLGDLAAVPGVIDISAFRSQAGQGTVRMPCDSLARLAGRPLPDCHEGTQTRLSSISPQASRSSLVSPRTIVRAGSSMHTLSVPKAIAIVEDLPAYWRLSAATTRSSPFGNARADIGGLIGGPGQAYAKVQQWLQTGLTGLLLAAAIALLLGIAEDTRARRRALSGQLALGAPLRAIRRAHRIEIAVRLGITAFLSLGVSAGLAFAARNWSGTDRVSLNWYAILTTAVLIPCFIAIWLGPLTRTPQHPEQELRHD